MPLITTGSDPKAMRPGVNRWFGVAYDEHKEQWPELFDKHTSEMAWEEDVLQTGFGLAQVKDQGKGKIIVDFLNWELDNGQPMATGLSYAPLPKEVAEKIRQTVKGMK